MKFYTFLDDNDNIIWQVKAENHDEAILNIDSKQLITKETSFYSEDY